MKRIDARFDDEQDADAARAALRDAGFDPQTPDVENPFFDPTVRLPEVRLGAIGAVLGGIVGLLLLVAFEQYLFQVPRLSPVTTAGEYSLAFLGLGLGVACGGFVGGAVGILLSAPTNANSSVAVVVPRHRVGEATELLRDHGASTVKTVVAYHEHPHRSEAHESQADDGTG